MAPLKALSDQPATRNVDFRFSYLAEEQRLSSNKQLSVAARFLGLTLMGRIDYNNYVYLTQAEMADLVGSGQGRVSKSLKELIQVGYVHPIPHRDDTRKTVYWISPYLTYRGPVEILASARARWHKRGEPIKRNRQPKDEVADTETPAT